MTTLLPGLPSGRARLGALLLVGGLLCLEGCEQPTPPVLRFNQRPKADAGSDRQSQVGGVVVLDGTLSQDPEGGDLSYAWIQTAGPEPVGIQNAGSSQAVFTAGLPGEYVFRLTVTDADGASGTDDIRVAVAAAGGGGPILAPPIADAGPDAVVAPGVAVILDGVGSVDLDGGLLSYSWIQVSGPTPLGILQADGPRARVLPSEEGDYVFRLTVTDDEGTSAVDEVRVRVASGEPEPDPGKGNLPPLADAGPDVEVFVADTVLLDGRQSSDADGTALTFAWIQISGPAPVAIEAADGEVARVEPAAPGIYVFRIIVIDADGETTTDEVRITVNAAPLPPVGAIAIEGIFGSLESGDGGGGT